MATKKHQKRIKEAVKYLQNYMRTYSDQPFYENYTDETLINDVLYGLGVAIGGDDNKFANGFEAFKVKLRNHLTPPNAIINAPRSGRG